MPDDGMKRAYRLARELLWDRDDTSRGRPEIIKQVHQADLIVVQGSMTTSKAC
jgi:hypothetical protein